MTLMEKPEIQSFTTSETEPVKSIGIHILASGHVADTNRTFEIIRGLR